MEYVMFDDVVCPIDTLEEISEAKAAMHARGIESLPVWYTPNSYDGVYEDGDPDGYAIPKTLFSE